MVQENVYYATGKRNTAIAKTWMTPGTGKISINNRTMEEYFPTETARAGLLPISPSGSPAFTTCPVITSVLSSPAKSI